MEIKLTLRIKPEHNPKEFTAGGGAGVLITQEMSLCKPDKWSDSRFALGLIDIQDEFLHKHCEVIIEEIQQL